MTLLAVSINHRTAGLDVLARTSMGADESREMARRIVDSAHVGEALVLSTCNRTEVYLDTERFHAGLEAVVVPLAQRAGLDRAQMPEVCNVYYDEAAVNHCFSLVAGLDSLVVGENQILGQVRDALSSAQGEHTSGPQINQLFQTALRVGKRVQSETSIGAAGRSVLTAALDQLDCQEVPVAGATVLVVGAGAMAGLAARTMASRGAHVDCVNRTHAKAERLAHEVGGVAFPMEQLDEAVASHDIVITCTGASGSLISAATLGEGRAPKAVLDLAMPPDVDPDVVLRGVKLINIASIKAASTDENVDVAAARALVGSEVSAFLAKQRAEAVTPTVVALRRMANGVVEGEMARLVRRVPGLDDAQRAEVANALNRVAEKLIHSPTVRVRQFAGEGTGPVDYTAALRSLFALEGQTVALSDPDDCPSEARAAISGEGAAVPGVVVTETGAIISEAEEAQA